MRPLLALTLIVFATFAASRAILGPYRSATVTSLLPALQLRGLQVNNANTSAIVAANDDSDPEDDPWALDPDDEEEDEERGLTPEQQEQLWCKAKSRGSQLIKAMMMNEQEAATMLAWPYIQSQWDGDLRYELKKWGYNDESEGDTELDKQCDFDKGHEMTDAFRDLKVDPRSAGQGGPNHCFYVEHMNGPTVVRDEDGELPFPEDQQYSADGRNFQVTQAYARVGINPTDGIVYFLHRQSPEDAAAEHWGRKPKSEELPALRSSSDITWGMWNRVASGSRKLNYFMSVSVVNPETKYIMERALKQYNIDKVPVWPGKDFEFAAKSDDPKELELLEMEAAFALLGSSNGLAAGYFLIQHRRQLSWKHIWKVKIWMAGSGIWASPNILLYVSDRAPSDGLEPQRRLDEQLKDLHISQQHKRDLDISQDPGVVYKSKDGRNVVREHVIMARL